jgi:ribosome-binding factor A
LRNRRKAGFSANQKIREAAGMPSFRLDRTSEDVKRELTDIMRGLKDPRINGLLSVLKVDLSKDLSLCRVYISSLEGMEAAKSAVEGLNSAAGYVRRELGQRIRLRRSPQIQFIADDSIEHSAHINQMLHDLKKD